MREGISVELSAGDRERLAAVVADRNSPQKHVWRARIILATVEGCGTAEIMRRAGVSKPCVWRWQERYMREGIAGLLRDKTRKPGLPPLLSAVIDRVVELTLAEPPGEATHWTGRAMAASGISLRSVQRIWAAHGLQRPGFNIAGLRRADLRPLLSQCSPATLSRQLARLRQLRVIKRVTGTYRYYLTRAGRAAIAAGRRLTEQTIIPALA
jgi:transposase